MNPVRLAALLAGRLGDEGERTGAALTVRELVERYVPYEVARRSLGVADRAEYEALVLEFLADRRLTVLRDPEVGEAASRALEAEAPDLGALEGRGGAVLRLDLATISGGFRGSAADVPGPAAGTGWDPTGGAEGDPAPESPTEAGARREAPVADDGGVRSGQPECGSCGRELPVGADLSVRFCPHCGDTLAGRPCAECGARLRPDWSWCPACGAEAGP